MRNVCTCLVFMLHQVGLLFAQPLQAVSSDSLRGASLVFGYAPAIVLTLTDNSIAFDTCYKIDLDTNIYPNNFTTALLSTSSICDTYGNPLLYTSYGGEPFNLVDYLVPGYNEVNTCKGSKFRDGYAKDVAQLTLILPKQGSEYYVFTTGSSDKMVDIMNQTGDWRYAASDVLSYYVVDMAMNNGLGQVTSVNNIIYEGSDTLSMDRMTAVRHANGRDWWLVKPHKTKQQLFTFLVTPNGVTMHDATIYNGRRYTDRYIRGQACFSSDGTKYAMVHNQDSAQAVDVYSFDRCNGTFSTYRRIPITTRRKDDGLQGIAFSPDGAMLYVASYSEINQIDLLDTTTIAITLIAKDAPNLYQTLALAVNDHIYVGNFHATHSYMSYIHQPNKKGLACDFRADGVRCDYTNLDNPPNVPNYRLGRLIGSPCDTVYKPPVPTTPVPEAWSIYPNPVTDVLSIAVPDSAAQSINASMCSSTGQLIARQAVVVNAQHVASINVGYLAKGVYVLKVSNGTSKFISKFVKE
jgi:Secretion system C-terminal sorting domain